MGGGRSGTTPPSGRLALPFADDSCLMIIFPTSLPGLSCSSNSSHTTITRSPNTCHCNKTNWLLPTDNIGTKNEVIKEQTSPNELNLVATKLFEDEERYVVLLHSWINPRHYTSGYFTAKTHLSLQHMIPLSAKSYSNWQWLQYTDSSHLSDLQDCCHFCLFCGCRTYFCLLDLHILTPILLSCTKITLTS